MFGGFLLPPEVTMRMQIYCLAIANQIYSGDHGGDIL
mgnify:CR=1 FL=1|jgi:hypothetical protein